MGEVYNPNLRRFGVPVLATLLLGTAACGSEEPPWPEPTTVTISWPTAPTCSVRSEVKSRTAIIKLAIENGTREGYYDVKGAVYDFGDGVHEKSGNPYWQQHTYAQPGVYAVTAQIIMTTTPQASQPEIPFNNGEHIACIPTTLQVW